MTDVVAVEVEAVVLVVIGRRGKSRHHGSVFQFQLAAEVTFYQSDIAHPIAFGGKSNKFHRIFFM